MNTERDQNRHDRAWQQRISRTLWTSLGVSVLLWSVVLGTVLFWNIYQGRLALDRLTRSEATSVLRNIQSLRQWIGSHGGIYVSVGKGIEPNPLLLADGKPHSMEIHEERLGGYSLVSVSPLYGPAGNLYGSVHFAATSPSAGRRKRN